MTPEEVEKILDIKRPQIPESSRPWSNFTLMLLTPEELAKLPNGTIVIDIWGMPQLKHSDICTETRGGVTAYGFLKEIDQ